MNYARGLLYLLLFNPCLYGQEEEDTEPFIHLTNHELTLGHETLPYTAITGFCPILREEGKIADLFFIAYELDDEENRPITFVLPGGPGGAGTIQSILTFGPRRLLTAHEGRTVLPPYQLIDNPETLLKETDLVFIDPINCGFSSATELANLSRLYSVDGDVEVLAEMIHSLIRLGNRWNSPIYLLGGSYGTLRACGIACALSQRYGILPSGMILNGCAFEFSTLVSERDQALADCLLIPTFAATAWYHKRLFPEKSLEEVVDYARRFAYDEYAPYMLQPSRLSYVEKLVFEENFATLIGLPKGVVRRYNARIDEKIYSQEFFGSERKVLGRLDSRYSGDVFTVDPDDAHDPSYLDSLGYQPAFNAYLQKELDTNLFLTPYLSFSSDASIHWDYQTYDSFGIPGLLQRLRQVLILNPLAKVFIGSGYYDCRTPFAATEYCFDHLGLPENYTKNLQFEYYKAGHGWLFDYPSLKKWKQDLVKFYKK